MSDVTRPVPSAPAVGGETTAPADPDRTRTPGEGADDTAFAVGPSADRYRLGDELARGGMGVVYRATDTAFDREVAIKVLTPGLAGTAARRFVEEACITGRLQHPSVPPVHDLGTLPDGRAFLAMKLIRGKTLADHMKAVRTAADVTAVCGYPADEFDRLVRVFEQICLAVAFAHSRGVIHRDLKPANVMVGAFGEVQVMDWGLAKLLGGRRDVSPPVDDSAPADGETEYGQVMGTLAYMPPEQARGEIDRVDERADVFALGAILCHLLTGRPPYTGRTTDEVWRQAREADQAMALARLEAVTGAGRLPGLARRCLSPDPTGRPAHAGEVAAAVASAREWAERVKRGEELSQATDEADRTSRTADRRSRTALALGLGGLGAGVVVAVVAGGIAWSYTAGVDADRQASADARVEAKRVESKEEFLDLTDAVARNIDAGRFAPGWDGQYRERMHARTDRLHRSLDPTGAAYARALQAVMFDAARERDQADQAWREAVKGYAAEAPKHTEARLAVDVADWFVRPTKVPAEFEKTVLRRAAQAVVGKKDLPAELAGRVEQVLKAADEAGVKLRR